MHHPINHLRGQGGHRSHLARSFRGHSGSCSPAAELRRTTFPMVPCGCHRAIKVLFQNSLHSETPPSRVPFSPTTPSRLSRLSGSNRRASARRRAVPRGTSGGGSLPGWVDGAGRERARGRGGGSVSAGRSGDQLAGGRAPNGAPALAAAPPPLRVAGRPGGRDNVAGLVAGRQPPSRLKWVPPGCCLSGRRGDPGGGGGSARLGRRYPRRPNPSFFRAAGTGVPGSAGFSAPGFFSLGKCMKRFPGMMAFALSRTQRLNS